MSDFWNSPVSELRNTRIPGEQDWDRVFDASRAISTPSNMPEHGSFQGVCPVVYDSSEISSDNIYGDPGSSTEALGMIIGQNRGLTNLRDTISWKGVYIPEHKESPEYIDLDTFEDRAIGNYNSETKEYEKHSEANYGGEGTPEAVLEEEQAKSVYFVYYKINVVEGDTQEDNKVVSELGVSSLYPRSGNIAEWDSTAVYWVLGRLYKTKGEYEEEIPDDYDDEDVQYFEHSFTAWRWRQYWHGGSINVTHDGTCPCTVKPLVCVVNSGGPVVYKVTTYESYEKYKDGDVYESGETMVIAQGNPDRTLPSGYVTMGYPETIKPFA